MYKEYIYESIPEVKQYMNDADLSAIPYKVNYKIIVCLPEDVLILYGTEINDLAGYIEIFDCWCDGTYYPNMSISGLHYVSYRLTTLCQ